MTGFSRQILFSFLVVLVVGGCSTVQYPLCPKIAKISYQDPNTVDDLNINRYIIYQTQLRGIQVEPLSPYVSEFTGIFYHMNWFEKNYRHMLCAFDSEKEPEDWQTYTACMNHANSWMQIVRTGFPENLLLPPKKYLDSCVE